MDNYDIINGKLYKKCTNNNIRNPKTLRCVNIKNPLGIRIIKNQNTNHCTNTTIFNPISQRCISIKSKIGRNLLGISHKYTLPTYNSNQDKILHLIKELKTELINNSTSSNDSISIQDRINIHNHLLKFLDIHSNNKNYCINFLKFDKYNNPIYIINHNIILKNKIGKDNIDSISFLTESHDTIHNKTIQYSSKIVLHNPTLLTELHYLSILSNSVIQSHSPHFPILYANLECHKFNYTNSKDLSLYPRVIKLNPNKSFNIILTELHIHNLKSFLKDNRTIHFIINSLIQCILSLLFFYKETKSFYNNINPTNFFYHNIYINDKQPSFFYYNIFDFHFYLPNQGFLWILSNFKKPIPFKNSSSYNLSVNYDIKELIFLFNNHPYPQENIIISKFLHFITLNNHSYSSHNLITFIKKICNFLKKNKLIFSNIPPDSSIINTSPFSIHIYNFK